MTRSAEAGAPRRFNGAGIPAKTNRLLVAGKATYVADIDIPGTLHMAVVRSPYAHARIRRVDPRAADALPGVVTTISGAEIRANTGAIPTHSPALGEKPCPIYALAIDKVRYAGEAGGGCGRRRPVHGTRGGAARGGRLRRASPGRRPGAGAPAGQPPRRRGVGRQRPQLTSPDPWRRRDAPQECARRRARDRAYAAPHRRLDRAARIPRFLYERYRDKLALWA